MDFVWFFAIDWGFIFVLIFGGLVARLLTREWAGVR